MGRTGSWFSAIKRVFTSSSKDRVPNEIEKRSSHERKGRGRLKHGESRSFIPLHREPSSIEKILGEVDQQLLYVDHHQPTTPQPLFSNMPASPRVSSHRATSPRVSSHRATSPRVSSRRATSPRAVSPKSSSPRVVVQRRTETGYRPEPTLRHHHRSATIIQAAYRGKEEFSRFEGSGEAARSGERSTREETDGQRHETNAIVGDEHWDDSLLTKEEREARLQRKMEAMIKRERAMAYSYSHQLWKVTQKSAKTALTDIRSGGFPWWWNWLERQLPSDEPTKHPEFTPTPPRPQSAIFKPAGFSLVNLDTPTPRSSKSTVLTRARPLTTPTQTPPSTTPNLPKYSKSSKDGAVGSPYPMKDDDSLMSCPPFSAPNYMSPTVSAKAKARLTGNRKDRLASTAASETSSKRRFSFPLTQTIGSSFKWNKRSSSKDSTTLQAPRVLEKHKSPRSIGDLSMDSSFSTPAAFGRKPFNRFV
ncbi:hypothetical protein L1987_86462 [Smallanthus sonchifolius]|uniref:Uncharacterized protein n=1 Tax=Smallanthus sonchifolius TaxID=185202 RepID=A0ACB8Y0A4_9ASTR|nr:hypothetical protein L1987_86462 [Smallanthus sonchifolius]